MSSSKWEEVTLDEICDLISRGVTPSYTDKSEVIVVNQKCIRDNRVTFSQARYTDPRKKNIPEQKYLVMNDILINSTGVGTLGRVAQIKHINSRTTVDSHVTIVRPSNNVCSEFLGYNLLMQQPNIEALAEGSTGQTELSRSRLGEAIKVSLPSYEEQKVIAATLACLDEKIELNNRMNKTLEEMAQAIFKSWFVDFEPFQDGEFEDSELGMIPKGWRVGNLDECIDFYNGYAFKSKELLDYEAVDGYRVFKMGHIKKGGGLNSDGTKSWISKSDCKQLGKYVLKKGDLLMCMTDMKGNVALLGHTALMNVDDVYIVNQRVGLLRVNNAFGIGFPYLYILTNSRFFIEDLRGRANSGVQVNLSTSEIKGSKLVIAPEEVNTKLNNIVRPMFDKIFEIVQENQILIVMRDTLLPKLMSGEIPVPIEEVQ